MKMTEHLTEFLENTVNLNTTRISLLDDSVSAIQSFLRSSSWEPRIKYFRAQGSWAHKTIIKPVANSAFDADLLVCVDAFGTWTARDYMSSLRAVFGNAPKYADKVRRYSHCVTIEYAGERKIDIAPCILDRNGWHGSEVCNFNTDSFEVSAPEAYTDWLIERNVWSGHNHLRKVTRLIKYLRDIKGTFTCPSFLLTTLLGQQVQSADTLHQSGFTDLPTALKTIVNGLDDWLQVRPTRPTVLNPVLPSELLSDVWDDLKYANFRSKIHTYRTWIDDAYGEQDRDESIGKWRRVFGNDYAKTVAIERAARVSTSARELVLSAPQARSQTHLDLVALFKQFGRSVLPTNFFRLPHKQRPPWRMSPSTQFSVRVSAALHANRNGPSIGPVTSGQPLKKNNWLRFQVNTDIGAPISKDFQIYWRVTNTDEEARQAKQLRGGFEKCNDGSNRWETLSYRGIHTIEAFVVRTRDDTLVAQSEPFLVLVE